MSQIIRRTIFATDNESSRYALGGVLLEMTADKITAVGTDGRRLAMMEAPAKSVGGHETGDNMTIVPTRSMHLIEKILTEPTPRFTSRPAPTRFWSRARGRRSIRGWSKGAFRSGATCFPSGPTPCGSNWSVGPLHSAVRQAAIVTSEESRGVDFTFGEGKVVLAGRAPEVGQSRVELPVAYDGPAVSITLDPRYFNDFLKVLEPRRRSRSN